VTLLSHELWMSCAEQWRWRERSPREHVTLLRIVWLRA